MIGWGSLTPTPQPGFIGPNYSGIVVIGTNPGEGTEGTVAYQNRMFQRLTSFTAGHRTPEEFAALNAFLGNELTRGTLGNNLLAAPMLEAAGLSAQEIAYLNAVKCATSPGNSNPQRVVQSETLRLCIEEYLSRQLALLRPRAIVFAWKPVRAALLSVGIQFPGVARDLMATYNGARNLLPAEKVREIRPVVQRFRALPDS